MAPYGRKVNGTFTAKMFFNCHSFGIITTANFGFTRRNL